MWRGARSFTSSITSSSSRPARGRAEDVARPHILSFILVFILVFIQIGFGLLGLRQLVKHTTCDTEAEATDSRALAA